MLVELYGKNHDGNITIRPFLTGNVNFDNGQDLRSHLSSDGWLEVIASGIGTNILTTDTYSIRCSVVGGFLQLKDE